MWNLLNCSDLLAYTRRGRPYQRYFTFEIEAVRSANNRMPLKEQLTQ